MTDVELEKLVKDCYRVSSPVEVTAALIHFKAAEMIAERLDTINATLRDLNENVWRSRGS